MHNPQIIKDLEFIKWQVDNKTPEEVKIVIDIIIKRYTPKATFGEVQDPSDANMCDSCQ